MNRPEELLENIPPSEEVEAYPLVLKLAKIDFVRCFMDEIDEERRSGFALAARYVLDITEDMRICSSIARAEDLDRCSRPFASQVLQRPLHF